MLDYLFMELVQTIQRIVLASGSPRRKELLSQAGYTFDVMVSNAEEEAGGTREPAQIAQHNALAKAASVAPDVEYDALIIGADTIVVLDGEVFGKPEDEHAAATMLQKLSGKTHQVITSVSLVCGDMYYSFSESTDVTFKELSDDAIAAYVATGEPLDKAGSYGIQGKGTALVESVQGDYENVVGLPMTRLQNLLSKLGIEPAHENA